MGNRKVELSRVVVKKENDEAAPVPPDVDQEEYRNVLLERINRTRLELQNMRALSAQHDQTIRVLTAVVCKLTKEIDEAYVKLMAKLQARRNVQVRMTAPASRSPAAAFPGSSCYGNPPLVFLAPFGRMTTQDRYYAQAAGSSYCFTSSCTSDSVVPTTATGSMPGIAGKKRTGSELGLVAQQMLRLPPKKREVVEALVHEDDADKGTTSSEETVSDAGLTEVGVSVHKKEKCCGGGECSLADSAASNKQ